MVVRVAHWCPAVLRRSVSLPPKGIFRSDVLSGTPNHGVIVMGAKSSLPGRAAPSWRLSAWEAAKHGTQVSVLGSSPGSALAILRRWL